jgi:predicted short-subunit dehydrogenase-like oxidoreductase (DUF2520 family)
VAVAEGDLPSTIDAELIVLAVPDGAIGPLSARLSREATLAADTAVLHLSGARPAAVIRDAGLRTYCGAMHPLQTLLGDGRPRLPFTWVLEGDPIAIARAELLVGELACDAVRLGAAGKVRYHAAATLAANHLVALARVAERQLRLAGLPGDRLPSLFIPLMEAALAHVAREGTAAALTGPLVRGDVDTVAGHLQVLGDSPADRDVYLALGEILLELAEERGTDVESLGALRVLFDGATCRPPKRG